MMFPALIQELDSAIADGTPPRRAKTLARITDIFVAGSDNYSANQIELLDDVFVRIAALLSRRHEPGWRTGWQKCRERLP